MGLVNNLQDPQRPYYWGQYRDPLTVLVAIQPLHGPGIPQGCTEYIISKPYMALIQPWGPLQLGRYMAMGSPMAVYPSTELLSKQARCSEAM